MSKHKLLELVDIFNGSTPSTSNPEYFEGDIPWLTPKDLSDQKKKYIERGERNISDKGLASIGNRLLPVGTILFSSRAPIGLMSIAKNQVSTNQGFKNIICKKEVIHNEYLYYLLKTKINQIQDLGTGTTFKEVSKSTLENFEIFIEENLKTQFQIAKVLSDLDAKIELNNRINAELEAMAKTLYDYWFVQFDFQDKNGKPYKTSGGKMVWNEELKREIPEGWEDGTFADYCPSIGGFAFKSNWWSDKGIAVAKIKDIQENYTIDTSELARVDCSDKEIDKKFLVSAGDILIAMTGATVGKYAIVPFTDYPIYVNQRVGYFCLGKDPIKRLPFLINSMNQAYFRNAIFTLANGAAQPNISNAQINSIQLLIPYKRLIDSYNEMFYANYKKILNNQKENQELTELRDWLLPMLMNGQVKVG